MTLLETFQQLTSFSPSKKELSKAPWEDFVDWAISQGLAPMAAYNLEYRLTGANAPEWARDRLLSVYQGSLNDNVMKLVNFKRAIDEMEGQRVILMGGANFAEAVYPHVAFRPVLDIRLLVKPEALDPLKKVLSEHQFRPDAKVDAEGATAVLSDGRTPIFIYSNLLGAHRAQEEAAIFERAMPTRVYGPSMFRLELEDAILLTCLEHARAGYELPYISFVDLRELLLGSPAMGGPYSRTVQVETLKQRAKAMRLERAVYASFSIVKHLFPETQSVVDACLPSLRTPTQALLSRLVIDPVTRLGSMRVFRGASRLRQLLSGG